MRTIPFPPDGPRHWLWISCVPVVLCLFGCGQSRPARVLPPAVDAAAVTDAIMARADADGDGRLSAAELTTLPALAAAREILDGDGDGQLSGAEIRRWLDDIKASRVAITSLCVTVTQRGKPLAGAKVRLLPEPFMGPETQPAEGLTDPQGNALVSIPGSDYPGVNCGLYRVEIFGAGSDGTPLSFRSNGQSILGLAVGGMLPENGMAHFALE